MNALTTELHLGFSRYTDIAITAANVSAIHERQSVPSVLQTSVPYTYVSQCRQSVPYTNVSQCRQSVPYTNVSQCRTRTSVSAVHERQSVPYTNVSQCRQSVPSVSAANVSAVHVCQSVPYTNVSQCRQSVPYTSASQCRACSDYSLGTASSDRVLRDAMCCADEMNDLRTDLWLSAGTCSETSSFAPSPIRHTLIFHILLVENVFIMYRKFSNIGRLVGLGVEVHKGKLICIFFNMAINHLSYPISGKCFHNAL